MGVEGRDGGQDVILVGGGGRIRISCFSSFAGWKGNRVRVASGREECSSMAMHDRIATTAWKECLVFVPRVLDVWGYKKRSERTRQN